MGLVAFLFPGQGSQEVGMGKELCEQFPSARRVYEQADDALGFSISKLCFEGPEDELVLTANSQPAILATSVALLRIVQEETGLNPDLVAGHSLGEFTALVCAEALRFEDAVRLVHKRGQFMQEAVPAGVGGMAAILKMSAAEVEALCAEAAGDQTLESANFNGGGQIVVSGHLEAVERAAAACKAKGKVARILRVSAPFHSSLMEPASQRLRSELEKIDIDEAKVPVIGNVEAEPYRAADRVVDLLTRQVTGSVKWEQSIRHMIKMGVSQTVEIGHGKPLTSMLRRIDRSIKANNVEGPAELEEIRRRTQNDLRHHVAPLGYWRLADGGHKIAADGSRVIWADEEQEPVDEERWTFNDNGTRIRKSGGMRIVWPDGRLEVLDEDAWEIHADGSMKRKDGKRII